MSAYLFIKYLHVSFAVLTLMSFSLRGYWMLVDSALLEKKLTRVMPHVIDTLLLLTAVVLVVMSRQYPFVVSWVTIKVVLLLVYIVLGTFALKRGRTRNLRAAFLAASLFTIAGIFTVALSKPGL